MFNRKFRALITTIALITLSATTLPSAAQEKTYYKEVNGGEFISSNKNNTKVEVVYFYSHNCKACRLFSPSFNEWAKAIKSPEIRVIRVPVTPNPSWIWATVMQLAIDELNLNVTASEVTKRLDELGVSITDRDSAIAFLMNELKVDYLTAEKVINTDRYRTQIERFEALFNEFEAAGTPNIGITTSTSTRYVIGPQLGINYYEMLSAINGVSTYHSN